MTLRDMLNHCFPRWVCEHWRRLADWDEEIRRVDRVREAVRMNEIETEDLRRRIVEGRK
jgi:hypothetical protein